MFRRALLLLITAHLTAGTVGAQRRPSDSVATVQSASAALPRVWVLATGGTIAGTGASATDLSNYKSAALLGEELVCSVPAITQFGHGDDSGDPSNVL